MIFRIRFLLTLTHQISSKYNTKGEETRTNCGKGQVERKNGGSVLPTIHFTVSNLMLLESNTSPSAGHPKSAYIPFSQTKISLMVSHTSYTKEGLNGKSPYDLFALIYGDEALQKLGIQRMPAREIILKPKLMR